MRKWEKDMIFLFRTVLTSGHPGKKLDIRINNKNNTVSLINEGEINILKTAGLTDIEFECDIPQVARPTAVYASGFIGASYFFGIL